MTPCQFVLQFYLLLYIYWGVGDPFINSSSISFDWEYQTINHAVITFLCSFSRGGRAQDLTFFAGQAVAMNRQLAEREECEEQQQLEKELSSPLILSFSAGPMLLSPSSRSKLALRRKTAGSLHRGPVCASELRQHLAPLVIVGDCAWSLPCFPASALHCWLLMTPFQNLQLGSALSSWPLCPLTLRALSSCEKDSHLCST